MITELFLLTNVRLLVCVVFSFEFECAYDLSESLPNAHYSYVQINWELSPPPPEVTCKPRLAASCTCLVLP